MKNPIRKFYEFLDKPLYGWSRLVIALLVIPLVLSFTQGRTRRGFRRRYVQQEGDLGGAMCRPIFR